eukprot:scaffold61445_cov55-Phaeocystis_antarctica.AAC.1
MLLLLLFSPLAYLLDPVPLDPAVPRNASRQLTTDATVSGARRLTLARHSPVASGRGARRLWSTWLGLGLGLGSGLGLGRRRPSRRLCLASPLPPRHLTHALALDPSGARRLAETPLCGCQLGCTHYYGVGQGSGGPSDIVLEPGWRTLDTVLEEDEQCVENEGTCEITLSFPFFGSLLTTTVKCQAAEDASTSANCFTPCALPPQSPPPPPNPPPPSPPPPSPPSPPSEPPPPPPPPPPSPSPDPNLPNPGCARFFVVNESRQIGYDVVALWSPIQMMLNGSFIDYLADDSTLNETTSCDQVAAMGRNSVTKEWEARGTSSLTSSGYALGWLGVEGEEIEFRHWNGEEEREYFVHEKFIMGRTDSPLNFRGSYNKSIGPVILELAEAPPCGCLGCKNFYIGFGFWLPAADDKCVENEGTCEITLGQGTYKCQTGKDPSPSANCFTP